ncbi:MAG: protoheme IX farnesyltransferase [Armatimonadetes bacterium]|nr:protoheme IX farnesyltransferase [Armatimonadota bacterium]
MGLLNISNGNGGGSTGRFARGVLLYTIGVIVFGAFVRATNSGDGCGAHWPLCNGEVIPVNAPTARLIEFTHRVTSGISGILIFALLATVFRRFTAGSPARKAAVAAMFFTIVEALLGAVLVKQQWVAQDASVGRAVAMSVHLVNTFFLLGSLVATAFYASGGAKTRWREQGAFGWALAAGLVGLTILGISGAVTALGDTLYPAKSLAEGIQQDLNPTAHFLIRLRMLHPLLAASVGLYMLLLSGLATKLRASEQVKKIANWLTAIVLVQIGVGILNIILMAPVWMQLVHLALADINWGLLVLLTLSATAEGVSRYEAEAFGEAAPESPSALAPTRKELAKAYVALTKPRVISLLLFTTLAAMFIAGGGWPGFWLFLSVAVGGYLAAGSANAINMVIDRDIDGFMKRTASRPTVTQVIPSNKALGFGLITGAASFAILWAGANLLTAVLAMAGLAFYVLVYTLALKRRTWQNIVIGGAAGAFPPLVGWAAVAGDLNLFAWLLFALIFVWTPVHFWALALLMKDDYAAAGVPMLPVVRGDRVTVIQIFFYAVLTAAVSLLPYLQAHVGMFYLVTAVVLNLLLMAACHRLYKKPERKEALVVFKYSMVYLALLFLVLAIDRAVLL